MEKDPSFFERLTFDPSLKKGPIARYFGSIRAILLIVFTLAGAGLVTFLSLPKELNPNIQIPIVFVTTIFPGAGPEDIEKLVTIPLEDAVDGLSGATLVSSTSQENVSSISIEFSSGTDPQKAKEDIQNAIDEVTDLPEDAEAPRVQVLDFQNQPVLTFVLSGNVDPGTLGQFSDTLEEKLKDAPGVEKVSVSYRKDPVITVTLLPETIREKHLSPVVVGQAISRALGSYPAGSLSNGTVFALTQESGAQSVAQLRALPLSINGSLVTLGEVATINETPASNSAEAYYGDKETAGMRALSFSVFKTDAADAGKTVEEINKVMSALNEEYDNRFIIESTFDGAEEIKDSFDQLFHDFSLTVFLVFTVLFIFFGLRQSVIASLAIPLTFLGTFIVMSAAGISVNFIALFSLLLALGILVDNAIVIISAMASYDRTGKFSPEESALLVWRDFRTVIFTTTITTVWAFLPLLLASGIIGEFIKPIPIVVSAALAISAAIALFIVTPLMAALLRGNFPHRVILFFMGLIFISGIVALFALMPAGPWKWPAFIISIGILFLIFALFKALGKSIHQYEESHYSVLFRRFHKLADQGLVSLDPFAHRYQHFIEKVLASKKQRRLILAALVVFTIFSYALFPLGYVVNEFFPAEDMETITASVELPQGTSLKESKDEMLTLLEKLRSYPDTRFVFGEIGAGMQEDGATGAAEFNHLLFTILLVPEKERDLSSGEIVANINREFGNYSHGDFSATQPSGGPPAGSDLQIKLLGEDLSTLQSYGKQ
ncbi:MAG: efflux RND transporter permease subunit, partial [Patescibacteria group bacterium]